MKHVLYNEIENGEIFLAYSGNYRKSVRVYKKLGYNNHKHIMGWSIGSACGHLYVQGDTYFKTTIFILKFSQSIDQLVTCFKLTDKELTNIAMDVI